MPADMRALLADLAAESEALDVLIAPLTEPEYLLPTPAQGWCIADQVSHLAYFDEAAVTALTDPDSFREGLAEVLAVGPGFADEIAARHRDTPGPELRDWFNTARVTLLADFTGVEPARRLPWYGPDMSAASSVTARLMETWAHGQDIADALNVTRPATARLRHIAHIGVRTVGFSYALRGLPVPEEPIRVELIAPDGDIWSWGPADAADTVRAPALDFCLVVTQRRHLSDTSLDAQGAIAREWMSIAQAFAGPPGPGRSPLRPS